MPEFHNEQLGVCLQDDTERAIVCAAGRAAGLVPVELSWPLSQGALAEQHAGRLALIVADGSIDRPADGQVDSPAEARLACPTAEASDNDTRALLLILSPLESADGFALRGEAQHQIGSRGVWRLKSPLLQETLVQQLGVAGWARRFFLEHQAALTEQVRRYRRIFDSICNGVSISDANLPGAPLVYVNPAFERMTGYTMEEVVGRSCNFLQGSDTCQTGVGRIRAAIREVREEKALLRNYRKDGTPFWNELYLSPIFDLSGALTHFVGIQNDVTAKMDAESRLREERDRLHAAAECSMDCLYICEAMRDADGEIVDFTFTHLNSNVEKMVSIPLSSMLGARMCELMPFNRTLGLFDLYKRVVNTGEPLVHEFRVEEQDVRSSWIRIQAVKLKDGIVITASDITVRKREEERTIYNAQHDSLTALPNRSVLKERIDQGVLWAKRHGGLLGVFLIDLDGFKQINDTLGHAAGDATLVTVASRLTNCLRKVDSVIRIGGDEFVVVMPELLHHDDTRRLAARIHESLRMPMQIAGRNSTVTASTGIAVYPDLAKTAEELLMRADLAMYAAKRRGKDHYEVFSPEDPDNSRAPMGRLGGQPYVATELQAARRLDS